MDYVIEKLFKEGFKPETKRETFFIEELKEDGFVYFDKNLNLFKFKEGIEKKETTDEVKLSVIPKINYLGLFPNVDNFTSTLPSVKFKHILVEFLGNNNNPESRLSELLKDLKLGQMFALTALGYGKNETNEGYKLQAPDELLPIMFKNSPICYMTTGITKTGKDKDTKNIDFVGVRPAKIMFKLGISTSFGVFFSMEDFKSVGKTKIIDKAMLK